MVQSLTWALECDRPQRRRSVLLQVLEVDCDEGRRLKRCARRSKFDEASSNVLVNRQDQKVIFLFIYIISDLSFDHSYGGASKAGSTRRTGKCLAKHVSQGSRGVGNIEAKGEEASDLGDSNKKDGP